MMRGKTGEKRKRWSDTGEYKYWTIQKDDSSLELETQFTVIRNVSEMKEKKENKKKKRKQKKV